MSDNSSSQRVVPGISPQVVQSKIYQKNSKKTVLFFVFLLAIGIAFSAVSLFNDVTRSGTVYTSYVPFLLLGLALLIALGFEFVNGFHDTANAVATVIYTHSLPPTVAVIWSGFFNFLGVLLSSGVVAFGIISLLPVELILQAGTGNGFAMVYALLFSAIIWNLGTWWFGLPSSSSHTLIGSIIGVGVSNALLHGRNGTSGVDWGQAVNVGYSLLLSPVVGFVCAAALLLLLKRFVNNKQLYAAPKNDAPPPMWIRSLLILTCTGVSFAHGSNDGQKGMGLIMLILVGTMPIAYALNRTLPPEQAPRVAALAEVTENRLLKQFPGNLPTDPREVLTQYVRDSQLTPDVIPALARLSGIIGDQIRQYGSVDKIPAQAVSNTRNDMYLASETIKHLKSNPDVQLPQETSQNLDALKKELDSATRFIPFWVKVAVAFALGLGTMVGWRRIVVTIGEKIGKTHLTYAQGASAELVAMSTIGAADAFGLPVSTTHVLSSGIAGTMAANHSGLQFSTVRNLLMAWVLTLPASVLLSAVLYWMFSKMS